MEQSTSPSESLPNQKKLSLKKRRALLSVSDKSGLIELAQFLVTQDFDIISTGGTRRALLEKGIPVVDISDLTQFPEVLDGRVKTLHPHVHMGLLARDLPEHQSVLEKMGLRNIDVLVCNLYPFEETSQKFQRATDFAPELVEDIDIGGVTLLRAAAKNFDRVVVLSHPSTYTIFIDKKGALDSKDRLQFAQMAFAHTSRYDALIAESMARVTNLDTEEQTLPLKRKQSLRYGENPHQKAKWMSFATEKGLHEAQQIQGKELSYNNILDLHACCELVLKMDRRTCVAVKHNNPCGVGQADRMDQAIELSLRADPVSVFGGIVAVNDKIDKSGAALLSEVFLECVIAPGFSTEALEIFSKKKNLRVLLWEGLSLGQREKQNLYEVRSVLGGLLLQERDVQESEFKNWKIISESPSQSLIKDLVFAERVVAQLKSNAIAIVENGQTIGLGMGQVNRVDAVEQAIHRMRKFHSHFKNPVLASDAFFPFADSIDLIAGAGIRWVIQPGGSLKDEDVIQAAKSKGVNLVLTGMRHFKH